MKLNRSTYLKLAAAALFFPPVAPYLRAQEARSFNFTVMGCAHMGVCESKDFALAMSKMRSQKPAFALFLGGMVDTPRGGDVEALWREFDASAAGLGVPVYDVPGSCSWGPLAVDKDRSERAKKCFSDRNKNRFYSFERGNSLFIGLDSGAPDGPGAEETPPLSPEQLTFLKRTLKDALKYDNIFIFLHDSGWMKKNAASWTEGVNPAVLPRIKYVFSAKEHYFQAERLDGVMYITTGSPPCALRRASRPVLFHFLIVTVKGGTVTVNVVPLKNIPLENMMSGKDRKGDQGKREGSEGEADEGSGKDGKAVKGRRAEQSYQINEPVMMDSLERKAMLPAGKIIAAMNIRPGMQIADVGAGVGVFTFPMAGALGGTGMVYATETDQKMIAALRREIDKNKYKNVTPVAVSAEGVDPFYKGRAFDIMLFSEIYHYLWDPVQFFRDMRPALAPETGRLYIIHFRQLPDYAELEFDDFKKIMKMLKLSESSPIFPKLAAGSEDFIRNWRGGEVPPAVRERLVKNFNALLSDTGLFNDLLALPRRHSDTDSPERGKALLKMMFPRNLELSRWLIAELESAGVFEKKAEQLTDVEKKNLRRLNKALLNGAFKMDKLDYLKGAYPLYAEKERIISQLGAAGYTFVREHAFLNYHYLLEFKQP